MNLFLQFLSYLSFFYMQTAHAHVATLEDNQNALIMRALTMNCETKKNDQKIEFKIRGIFFEHYNSLNSLGYFTGSPTMSLSIDGANIYSDKRMLWEISLARILDSGIHNLGPHPSSPDFNATSRILTQSHGLKSMRIDLSGKTTSHVEVENRKIPLSCSQFETWKVYNKN